MYRARDTRLDRLVAIKVLRDGAGDMPTPGTLPNFDVSPDGRRFLVIKESEGEGITQINVVLNWSEELKRTVRD